jgi:hypothetical protein
VIEPTLYTGTHLPGTSPRREVPGSTSPAGPALDADGAGPAGSKALMVLAKAMSEGDLEENIRGLCNLLGVLRFHVPDSRGMERGLPDDLLIGPCGVLWRECKNMTRKLTSEQQATGEALKALGQDFAVWRPIHWHDGTIERELKAIAGHRPRPVTEAPAEAVTAA